MPTVAELRAQQSVGSAIDPRISAASMRGPMRGEILVINVQNGVSRTYNVPNGMGGAGQPDWRGRIINLYAEGGDVFVQLSDGLDAAVDPDAVAAEALSEGRYTLTPHVSGNGCWRIPSGQWIPVPFAGARTFALRASAANVRLRTHIAET